MKSKWSKLLAWVAKVTRSTVEADSARYTGFGWQYPYDTESGE